MAQFMSTKNSMSIIVVIVALIFLGIDAFSGKAHAKGVTDTFRNITVSGHMMMAATSTNWLYYSADGGATFSPTWIDSLKFYNVQYDLSNPSIMYGIHFAPVQRGDRGPYHPSGIYKSIDYGKIWKVVYEYGPLSNIYMHHSNPDFIYAMRRDWDNIIWYSNQKGEPDTWQLLFEFKERFNGNWIQEIIFHPQDSTGSTYITAIHNTGLFFGRDSVIIDVTPSDIPKITEPAIDIDWNKEIVYFAGGEWGDPVYRSPNLLKIADLSRPEFASEVIWEAIGPPDAHRNIYVAPDGHITTISARGKMYGSADGSQWSSIDIQYDWNSISQNDYRNIKFLIQPGFFKRRFIFGVPGLFLRTDDGVFYNDPAYIQSLGDYDETASLTVSQTNVASVTLPDSNTFHLNFQGNDMAGGTVTFKSYAGLMGVTDTLANDPTFALIFDDSTAKVYDLETDMAGFQTTLGISLSTSQLLDIRNGQAFTIGYYDEEGNSWQSLPTVIDTILGVAYTEQAIDHFSKYGIYAEVLQLASIDLNANGEIDIWDVAVIAEYFGQTANANPACDLNGNGEIDIWDVAVVAEYFGQSVE